MATSLLSLLVFVAVFALVVFIHEFGHFVVARLLKVEVDEFGFGLPPRLMRLFRWKLSKSWTTSAPATTWARR